MSVNAVCMLLAQAAVTAAYACMPCLALPYPAWLPVRAVTIALAIISQLCGWRRCTDASSACCLLVLADEPLHGQHGGICCTARRAGNAVPLCL
jgi:hypothetical protein